MNSRLSKASIILISIILFNSCQSMVSPLGGNYNDNIEQAKAELSAKTKEFIDNSFSEFSKDDCLLDFHVHAIGMAQHKDQTWVNPKMSAFWPPKEYIKYHVFKSAGGIHSIATADDDYIDRLVRLQRSEPRIGKLLLFAFDYYYTDRGVKVPESSTFYVENEYVLNLSLKYPDVFIPVASIHPYRKDALSKLDEMGKKGVKFVKWLPNSQNIDPSSKAAQNFYSVMKKYGMTLISHTGHEKAVHGEEHQALGNPLRLKRAMDMGVKVVMAHLASLGLCKDSENSDVMAPCFDLFWRIINDSKYAGLAYGEMSGTTIHTRIGAPYNKVLEHPELKHRFVNGSDYPLPAINLLYRTKQYLEMGYITKEEREILNEIYQYNPLLFDFMSKRILKHPKLGTTLSKEIFTSQDIWECNDDK